MKFFHLSDLHIGLKLYDRDLSEDQEDILRQITDAALLEQPDAVVIAGDIYDKAIPSAEAVDLFNQFISRLTQAVPSAEIMIISGNHDSAARIDLYRDLLKHQKVHMIGKPPMNEDERIEKLTLEDEFGPVNFYLLPFVKPSMVRKIVGSDENGNQLSYNDTLHRLIEREKIDESLRNVFVSHQFYLPAGKDASEIERMDSEIRTVGNIDEVRTDFFSKFDYVALGHIHKPMAVGGEFYRYCGTPLPCSFSEANQKKGIIEVDLRQKGCISTSVLPLTPRHEVRVVRGPLQEVLQQRCDDYTKVILTDRVDLNIFEARDRLYEAYPNLLEIGRETESPASRSEAATPLENPDPFSLCCSFLKELDCEEEELLRDVINTVQEEMPK